MNFRKEVKEFIRLKPFLIMKFKNVNQKTFFKIKFYPSIILSEIQSDLKKLFNDVLSKKVIVSSIEGVGFKIPFELISKNSYPILYQWMNKKPLKNIMDNTGFRLLWTDPNQFDSDTPTKKLDRYFPHLDKSGSNKFNSASLNVPIKNCDAYTTLYWHKINPLKKEIVKLDCAHILYEESKNTIFENFCMNMTSAFLIRTDIFHSVRNFGHKKRIIAGWQTKPNISWNKILNYFLENNLIES